jgi:assimilatory nitrate reductase electron transfer subunit
MTQHVVIVGNGMAGSRLADELRRREPDPDILRIAVIGEEQHPAYNRVLLSSVVGGGLDIEGVQLYPAGWYGRHHVELFRGVRVVAVDRRRRLVFDSHGRAHGYDVLVLATGSRSWVPPVEGLAGADGQLAGGVVTFRTASDCERIVAAAQPGGLVAVLGGGLLGLEAARGVVGRGAAVTVLHPVGHLMERQLDPAAGRVLARTLDRLGINVRLNVSAVRRRQEGIELSDGGFQPADLVVVAAGVRAETTLARQAGLEVHHGIVVDDELRSVTDPRVRAIGECAEHRGTVHGLVQPAWDQAAALADLLTGADPAVRYTGSAAVTRLKARDVDLATMGETFTEPDDDPMAEVVRLEDPARGRYAKLVLRDERVAGAIVLGCPEAAAALTQLFDSRAPVPADRLGLLVGRGMGDSLGQVPPALLPARALICRCNSVTKAQLTTAWLAGARTVTAQAAATRATTGCGSCADAVAGLCEWLASADPEETVA